MSERESLEIEVAGHRARVDAIAAELERIEGGIGQAGATAPKMRQQAALLRMELKGRTAAVEVGSARLRTL